MDVIHLRLSLRKPLTHRHRRRQVARIVRLCLCSCIQEEDITLLQVMDKTVVMEHLSLSSGNRRKSQRIAVTTGHLLHSRSHLRLMDAGAHCTIGRQMHLRTQVHTLFDQSDLLFILIVTLGNDGLDKGHRGLVYLCCRLHAKQLPQPHTVVASIWREEMHGLSLCAYLIYIVLQLGHRQGLRDSYRLGLFFQ